jgi:cobalt/nickel transport system permease protein
MRTVPLPTWLTGEENYKPAKDRDAFIDKSILSVLGVLSRIRAQGSRRRAALQAHAEVKLPVTLLLIVLLTVSRSLPFVFIVLVGLLCRLCVMHAEDIAVVLRSSLIAAVFTAAVLLPAALAGNTYSIAMITPKVFASVTAAALLAHGTRWNSLTGALKAFFLPDLFIFVLDITIKYILLLGEFALNMLYALRLRSVGRNDRKHASLSGVAGTLFIKSGEMATELHAAMECRGFTGEYRRPGKFSFNALDGASFAVAAAAVLLLIYLK